ncbi:MAG TPA: hypothetical protein VJ836_07475 [Candidatus Saccharimonadales bacterium]|nr:hypothetical protein [Candidatus Saccharimonadales bacterium]
MGKRQLRHFISMHWQLLALYSVLAVALATLLGWQLGTLTGGYAAVEQQTFQASNSLEYILHHPVNAPFALLTRGLLALGDPALLFTRVAAVLLGLGTLAAFFFLVQHWHGLRSATIGTLLFGTSAWFLHTARLGTPDVLLFGLLALIACGLWLRNTQSPAALLACVALASGLLYVPGMVWFVVLGVLWQWRTLDRIFKEHLLAASVGGVLLLAIIAPLGWGIYQSPDIAKVLVGLPAEGWPAPLDIVRNAAQVPFNLFFRGPAAPEQWLGRLPVLDAFCLAMFGLGIYLYLRYFKLRRSVMLWSVLIGGIAVLSLGGAVSLSLVVPFMYIVIAAGIGLLLDRWYMVFPRNIIAQSVGTGLAVVAIAVTTWYSTQHYFVAWPNAPATRAAFSISDTMR